MSAPRRAKRVDANQPEIVKQLRAMGCTVETDKDDILVGWQGKTFWFEIKESEAAAKKKSGSVIRQRELEQSWRGHYRIVWTLDQILADIGAIK